MVETNKGRPVAKSKKRSSQHHRISAVARMLDVSPSTLRQWENMGLMKPARTPGGYRAYTTEQVDRLKYIQRMRIEKNLNIEAILHLLGISGPPKTLSANGDGPDSSL